MRSRIFFPNNWRRRYLRRSTKNVSILSKSFNTIRGLASRCNENWFLSSNSCTKAKHCSARELESFHYEGQQYKKNITAMNIKEKKCEENTKKMFSVFKTPWRRTTVPGHRFWALDILIEYIKLRDFASREKYWNETKSKDCGEFLPTILVHLMHWTRYDLSSSTPLDSLISSIASNTLVSQGLDWKDVEDWAYIISTECPDKMTARLCKSSPRWQPFIVLYILRQDVNSVHTLEKLYTCVWDLVLGRKSSGQDAQLQYHSQADDFSASQKNITALNLDSSIGNPLELGFSNSAQKSSHANIGMSIDLYTFKDLAKFLIRNSRRIWPALMVNVAQMTSTFAHLYVAKGKSEPKALDSQTSRQLCHLINSLIYYSSHMSNFEPYVLINYNWESQKTLLKLAAEFHPALVLNQASYRAIVQVFAAHQKTSEQRASMLRRSREWPPWPIAQHGMDIDRINREEVTKVVAGVSRLKEAGYGGNWFEDALRIIGGQEFDGTPSIQTRNMLPWPKINTTLSDDLNPNLWAARVTATRDVYEAWSAFSEFRKLGGQPNEEIFFSMFQKLTYETIRGGRRRFYDNVVPGDGLEVLSVPENNYSDYYRRHLEPPSIEALYSEMLSLGILPQNRILSFLVRTSRTPDEGFKYLRAHGLSMDVLRSLGSIGSIYDRSHIMSVPLRIFSDFIYLICRFVPRLVQASPVSAKNSGNSEWTIHHLKTRSSLGLDLDQPLNLTAYLLSVRKPKSCPPWYSYFRAITREKSIISRKLAGHPENDILAWKLLRTSLDDFLDTGLCLNTRGFIMICHGFDKFMRAVFRSSNVHQMEIDSACKLLKSEFRKLTETSCGQYDSPRYYQSIRGVYLHAYIRCLALVKDYEEIMSTLKWMSSNSDELENVLRQESPNGKYIFRRVLIVIGICFRDTCFEHRARLLISSVKEWGGWPEDHEIEKYKRSSPKGSEIPNIS